MKEEEKKDGVTVSLSELIRFNIIKKKHENLTLELADQQISLFKSMTQLNKDTSIEELNSMLDQIRALENKTKNDIKSLEDDKKFVDELQRRSKP